MIQTLTLYLVFAQLQAVIDNGIKVTHLMMMSEQIKDFINQFGKENFLRAIKSLQEIILKYQEAEYLLSLIHI